MKGEWCYRTNQLTSKDCEYIIDSCLKRSLKQAQVGLEGTISDERKSRICLIHKDDPEFSGLLTTIMNAALEVNDEWFGFHLSRLTCLQFTEYDATYGGEFKPHQDVFWMNNDPKYHRKLSIVIQLSDPSTYSGGNFEFSRLSGPYPTEHMKKEIKQQGTVLFFPSFIEHGVTPVTEGKRYSLCCWIDGPKWR
jgi:PKHD-type hydroxylase